MRQVLTAMGRNARRSAIARPGSVHWPPGTQWQSGTWNSPKARRALVTCSLSSASRRILCFHLAALPFRLTARVAKCEKRNTEDYDPGVHAAQYQWFVTVQNLREGSPGYGDYYWFGIQLFDDRNPVPPAGCHVDLGTSKLIYAPGGDTYASESTHGGGPVTFEGDLLPEVLVGLERAWAALGDPRTWPTTALAG